MLISTKPKNEAEAAVIARAKQLTDFKWTPVRDVPTYLSEKMGNGVLPAGVEQTGFPYASTERTDKFFCENISFETFLSAIPNPDSKLYQPGHAALSACNFGVVCNGLVRYAFGIRGRVNTQNWAALPGMRLVKLKGEYTVDEMQLCDILHAYGEGRNHVSLITDIIRNENGKIEFVEVSEAIRPTCKRKSYTPEEYYEKFKLFSLYRYDLIDTVPPFDEEKNALLLESGIEKIAPKIAVDNGNKSNYREDEEVIISSFAEGENTLLLYRDGAPAEEIKVCGKAKLPRALERGYYKLVLKDTDECVEFAVTIPEISYVSDGKHITVHVDAKDENSKIIHMDFRKKGAGVISLVKFEKLTEEEKESGIIKRSIPENAGKFKIYFENKYGIWTHKMINID